MSQETGVTTVRDWLLDSDPAIRWQVLRDLIHAPAEVVAAERITARDPTSRAIWMRKFEAEENRRVAPVVPRRWRPRGW